MNLLQRTIRRHAVTGTYNGFPLSSFLTWSADGAERIGSDFRSYVTEGYQANGPIFSLVTFRMMVISGTSFQWRNVRTRRTFGTPELGVLERPWPGGTTQDLLLRLQAHADLAGNAYAVRTRDRRDRIRVPDPSRMRILLGSTERPGTRPDDLDAEVIGYVYQPRPGDRGQLLLPDEVAHYAPIPDPLAVARGMSWLTPVARDVDADAAMVTHKRKFFEYAATPNMLVKIAETLSEPAYDRLERRLQQRHSGSSNAYRTLILEGGADATIVGKDLQQIDFKSVQGAGETRLASAAQIPVVLVGFSEGLAGSSLNLGNYQQARRRAADATFHPLWMNLAGSLSSILTVPPGTQLWHDPRDVPFLREDAEQAAKILAQQAQTARTLTDGGWRPDAAIDAVVAGDLTILRGEHSGLSSVQLVPPDPTGATTNGDGSSSSSDDVELEPAES